MGLVETLQERAKGMFPALLGVTFIEASPDRIKAELNVRDELSTVPGVIHGGAIMALADCLGGAATVLNLPSGARTTTIESKTNFFRALRPSGSRVANPPNWSGSVRQLGFPKSSRSFVTLSRGPGHSLAMKLSHTLHSRSLVSAGLITVMLAIASPAAAVGFTSFSCITNNLAADCTTGTDQLSATVVTSDADALLTITMTGLTNAVVTRL